MNTRSGIGFDVHPLVTGRRLVLGGVHIPFEKGLKGHSDGDALTHAIIDALLGGAGMGDIGTHFPSSDKSLKDIDSQKLLVNTMRLLDMHGWRATYVDATIIAERPVLRPHCDSIKAALAVSLGIDPRNVNIKAKTTDGLGFTGRGEGIAAMAIATLQLP
ncbi:MAG: 2-C-methyl-D-erythritol 2,4-cyclodiphosphate synthase [SAR202 cluster bacterium]|nr:2-C-methyl-D-erythritol 2,4-cyclodiphosphate synthase [SAR202 cluster bacterium]